MTKMPEENAILPEESPTLRVMARPIDTNAGGDIFGGWIMSQVDIAGSVAAYRRAQGRVVTVAVNSFHFHKPVYVGDLVSLYARVVKVGRTSITVDVRVFAERMLDGVEQCMQVTEAVLTYVAIDRDRKPRAVPDIGQGC
jgi:acyl-CoA thioesterase YciA